MTDKELKAIRHAVADYIASEGCDCCRAVDRHDEAEARLATLLKVPKYSDNSGYNFSKFASKP